MILSLISDNNLSETKKVDNLKEILANIFDFGNLSFDEGTTLARYAGKSSANLWILKALPKRCLNDFYLSNISIKFIAIVLFKKEMEIFSSLYEKNEVGNTFLRSLSRLNYAILNNKGLGNDFISALFDVMKDDFIDSVDQ
ncbi:hypothetical protein M9Y10_019258 [Tritrichomonas musculus]|uniref:Uncharacterized protein n=1 Tax=Tritrichomonas musculus TaxID=1915356 RepID=A0ABR2HIY1_9EUKA